MTSIIYQWEDYICVIEKQELVLDSGLKLCISQNQQPTASSVIFCDESTTVEHVECLWRCACIKEKIENGSHNHKNWD